MQLSLPTLLQTLLQTSPRHISYIATHNHTLNYEGKPRSEIPVDQMLEHYNL